MMIANNNRPTCTRCGGTIYLVSARPTAESEPDEHFDMGTCISVLRQKLLELELEQINRPGIQLSAQEATIVLACLGTFMRPLGQIYGQGPAILIGLLAKRAGMVTFKIAGAMPEEAQIDALQAWYNKEQAKQAQLRAQAGLEPLSEEIPEEAAGDNL